MKKRKKSKKRITKTTLKYYNFKGARLSGPYYTESFGHSMWRLKTTSWFVYHNGHWETALSPVPYFNRDNGWKDTYELTEQEAFMEML